MEEKAQNLRECKYQFCLKIVFVVFILKLNYLCSVCYNFCFLKDVLKIWFTVDCHL